MPIANHAKFWMVDGRVFYIGSDNMYPVNLQEYGYIVDDAKAAQRADRRLLDAAVAMVVEGGGVGPGSEELHLP